MIGELCHHWQKGLHFEGLILEDPEFNIWGSSPVWGEDGLVHVFSSRIPKDPGFYLWWATSEIAHYVASKPEGPYTLKEVLLKPGDAPKEAWDHGTKHNPTITKIDDLYVLSYHSAKGTIENRQRESIRIGMMTSKNINGPWSKLGMMLDPPTPQESNVVTGEHYGFTDNPSLVRHPDGRYFLYYRIKFPGLEGENTYGVAIADQLEGPYHHYPERVVNNPSYIEDPYVFIWKDVFYMLITDNHGPNGKEGMILSSKDGLFFDYREGVRFGKIEDYIPEKERNKEGYQTPDGFFERPQLLIQNGCPTHFFTPSLHQINGSHESKCYLFSIKDIFEEEDV